MNAWTLTTDVPKNRNVSHITGHSCVQYKSTQVYNTRVHKYKSARVKDYKSTRVQEYKSTRVQEYKSTRVQEYKSKRVKE